ncbi:hypothetical protein K438DRAFT_1583048, partial [Mycena galopus ATCC 62051]
LHPLISLKWPYVPEKPIYPDPLKQDEPKPLQTHQYEAIATSPAIRTTIMTHPNLPVLLSLIHKLCGLDSKQSLQRALGVIAPEIATQGRGKLSEDVLTLCALAEAVEAAVQCQKAGVLGLDCGE